MQVEIETFKDLITVSGLTQKEAAQILNVSINTISKRINNPNSFARASEIRTIEKAIGAPLYFNNAIGQVQEWDQVKIKYLRIPGIDNQILQNSLLPKRLQFDKDLINNLWHRNADYLRIIKMRGNKMDGGEYPLRANDILIIDISAIDPADSGMYIYTTDYKGHREVFVSCITVNPDRSYRFFYLNKECIDMVYTSDQLNEMNFKVWGRVVKNISLTK